MRISSGARVVTGGKAGSGNGDPTATTDPGPAPTKIENYLLGTSQPQTGASLVLVLMAFPVLASALLAAPLRAVSVWKSENLLAEDCGDEAAAFLSEFLATRCRLVRIGEKFTRPIPKAAARLGDVVSFADAFPLLVVLQRNNFPLDGVQVRLGEYIKLSPNGPIVPLDRYGRLAMPLKSMSAFKEISAEALIDGGDSLFPKTAPDPVILRDDQSSAEPATRAFSKKLSAMVAAIASDEGFSSVSAFPRLSGQVEAGMLAVMAFSLTLLCGLPAFSRYIAFSILAGVVLSAQWVGAGLASVWLPVLPLLATIAARHGPSLLKRPGTSVATRPNCLGSLNCRSVFMTFVI